MLSIVDTTVSNDIYGKHAVLVLRDYFRKNGGLVNDGAHRKRVVARHEYEVVEGRTTDVVAFYIGVKGYVALRGLVKEKAVKDPEGMYCTIDIVMTVGLGM